MDHRTLLASLTAADRARLTATADAPALRHLVVHGGLIGLGAALIAARVPWWPVLLVPQGILIVFLFTLLHETIHRTAFASRWLNDAVARAVGMILVLPADWFRYFHFAHHRFTQDPANDPELASPKPETRRQYLWHVTGLPLWWSQSRTLARNAAGACDDAFVPSGGKAKVVREARLMLAVYALALALSVAIGSSVLVWIWLVPMLLGQPFLRLYLLAEHGRCPLVANMLENSRTTFTTWAVRKLAWNMPYHAEHHAYPGVPYHRLPDFHRLTRAHLKTIQNGYVRFHRDWLADLD